MSISIALRISVNSYRGALVGLPRLVDLLRRHGAHASFLFNLGPDRSGRAVIGALRTHRPVRRAPLREEHGFKGLLRGLILPAPEIAKQCRELLLATREAGHECAIQGWDRSAWLSQARDASSEWTEIEMQRAAIAFTELFGIESSGHGAADWIMNRHALRMTQRLGLRWASDCRGTHPFLPIWEGEPVHCPQLPTTLPTLDEALSLDGQIETALLTAQNATATAAGPQVFALSAEREGIILIEAFDRLLTYWRDRQHIITSLGGLRDALNPMLLPRHLIGFAPCSGRIGNVLTQGAPFLP